VGARAGLDAVAKKKSFQPPCTVVIQPVASIFKTSPYTFTKKETELEE